MAQSGLGPGAAPTGSAPRLLPEHGLGRSPKIITSFSRSPWIPSLSTFLASTAMNFQRENEMVLHKCGSAWEGEARSFSCWKRDFLGRESSTAPEHSQFGDYWVFPDPELSSLQNPGASPWPWRNSLWFRSLCLVLGSGVAQPCGERGLPRAWRGQDPLRVTGNSLH